MKLSADGYIRWVLGHRLLVILAVFGSVALFGYFASTLSVDNDSMKSIPENLHEKVAHRRMQELFSTPFTILFIAEFQQGTLTDRLDSVKTWAARFERMDIDGRKGIQSVAHLGTLQVPEKGGFLGITSRPVIPESDGFSEEEARRRIDANRDFTAIFISEDEQAFGMILSVNPEAYRPGVIRQVTRITDEINQAGVAKAYITGEQTHSYFIDRKMREDFSRLLPVCLVVASFLLYYIFRRIVYVLSVLLIIGISLLWTFGLMGMAGVPLSVVTSVIPVILFPVGVAVSIHIIRTFSRHRWKQGKELNASLVETYGELVRPVFLTSATTFFGFGSFVFSSISWTRHFGIFTGIGVMISLLLSLVLLPIVLYYEPRSFSPAEIIEEGSVRPGRFLGFFRTTLFETRFWQILLVVIAVIFVAGIMRVRVESNPIAMFSKKSAVYKSDELIGKYFGGTRFFSIALTNTKDKLSQARPWHEVDSIIRYIESRPNIGNVSSLMPLVRRAGMLISQEEISDAGVSLLVGGGGLFGKRFKQYIDTWLTQDRQTTRLMVTCRNVPGYKYTELAKEIEAHICSTWPHWDVLAAGPALLIDSMISLLIQTQISSLILAFSSVFLVLALLFRSLKTGFFATIPMILSTLSVYALMGLFNVTINSVTVVIVNTCIGIGIDYSIHFVAGYLYIRNRYSGNRDALMATVANKGAVIMLNTMVVGVGFLVLTFSSFPPLRDFGLFVGLSMLISALFALIFLPLLFKGVTVEKTGDPELGAL